jgi:hypothetical protein
VFNFDHAVQGVIEFGNSVSSVVVEGKAFINMYYKDCVASAFWFEVDGQGSSSQWGG